jgi:methylated-DNA-[protein]-cysteine S-methyltransferase
LLTKFDESVWQLLRRIPKGKVTTYKRIAIALGKPNASRAVGNACNRNPNAPRTSCHRVVKSDGSIGGYAKGVKRKIALLRAEGVRIKNNKVLDLSKNMFNF